MDHLGRKRKGVDTLASSGHKPSSFEVIRSHVSLGDYLRKTKKCKEVVVAQGANDQNRFITGIVTAPPFVSVGSDPRGRGLKRKIGCIDSATRMGRKKKIEQDFERGETIGQGKFGSVVMCRSKVNGDQYACKSLPKGEEIVHKEVEIMQHLSGHPGVVTLKAVYEDAQHFHLVMELCSGGRLLDQMRKDGVFSEQKTANLIKELMLVLKFCHEMGVIHRDVKPENILLSSSGSIKLADFGLAARISNGQTLYGVVGSPAYVAPEVLTGGYSEKVDIWSAGVVLHALLVGFLPFGGDSVNTVFEAVKNVSINFQGGLWDSISQPARDLIAHMLTRNVSERYSAEEVLRHPWILFYTNPSLDSLTFSSKLQTCSTLTSQQLTDMIEAGSMSNINCYNENSTPMLPDTISKDEDSCMVDVLALAISRIRISGPKRSRIYSPTNPAQQEHSSNITIKSLCKAF
ncbi:Protein kinase, ATP binding site-containing protein [Artemisia annua]|uniref:Protein kinase, ATP binding site-containing protein n=1 Tax=Artemisia annua TaxID=35608 RepID=A0A2U1Q3P3_ARTAN|nr:Protein kinase, ATP binding site-containing protein [Artemisia annua]